MSVLNLRLVFFFVIFWGLYESYNLHVDYGDFGVSHRRKIDAQSDQLFNFLMLTHVLEKWFPATPRFKVADARILGVGKHFQTFFKLPLIGEWHIYLMTTDYKRGKLLALESDDGIFNPRFELTTDVYHDKTILQVTMYFQKSSALFHYTIGTYLRSATKHQFKEAMNLIEEMYKTTNKYRELT